MAYVQASVTELPAPKVVTIEKPLTPQQLHEYSGFSTKLIYSWINREFDSLPCIHSGSHSYVYAEDFNRFVEREKDRR